MPSCKECIHYEVCRALCKSKEELMTCVVFKHRSHFVELPCKLGDEIFYTTMGRIYQGIVGRIELDDEGLAIITTDGYCLDSSICYHMQEEAEQALKECENNGNL